MCTFISFTVSSQVDLPRLHKASDHALLQIETPPILHRLPADRLYFVHRQGHCDCGSAIGMMSEWSNGPFSPEELVAIESKGGSRAKVEQWKRRRVKAYENRRIPLGKDFAEMQTWLEMARRVLALPSVKRFGFMHHFYSGWMDTDDFEVVLAPIMSIGEATEETLLELPEDTLQEFRP